MCNNRSTTKANKNDSVEIEWKSSAKVSMTLSLALIRSSLINLGFYPMFLRPYKYVKWIICLIICGQKLVSAFFMNIFHLQAWLSKQQSPFRRHTRATPLHLSRRMRWSGWQECVLRHLRKHMRGTMQGSIQLPQVFKRSSWTLTHKNDKAGHSGAAETSWVCTVNTASTFNSYCWKCLQTSVEENQVYHSLIVIFPPLDWPEGLLWVCMYSWDNIWLLTCFSMLTSWSLCLPLGMERLCAL